MIMLILCLFVMAAISVIFSAAQSSTETVYGGRTSRKGKRIYDIRYSWRTDCLLIGSDKLIVRALLAIGVLVSMLLLNKDTGGIAMASLTVSIPAVKKLLGWTAKLTGANAAEEKKVFMSHRAWWGVSNNTEGDPLKPAHGVFGMIRLAYKRMPKTKIVVNRTLASTIGMKARVLRITMPEMVTSDLELVCKIFKFNPLDVLDVDGNVRAKFEDFFYRKWKINPTTGQKMLDNKKRWIPEYITKGPGGMSENSLRYISANTIAGFTRNGTALIDKDDVTFATPSHILGGDKNDIYVFLRGTGLSADGMFDKMGISKDRLFRNSILIRIGKDIMNTPVRILTKLVTNGIETIKFIMAPKKVVKFLIKDKVENSWDGAGKLRGGVSPLEIAGEGGICLVRGFPVISQNGVAKSLSILKNFFLLKARMVTMTDGEIHTMDTFTTIPEGIDGVTTLDNTKWLPKNHNWKDGDVVDVLVTFSKNEMSESHERYNINLITLIIGNWVDESAKKIRGWFKASFQRTADAMVSPARTAETLMAELMSDDAEDGAINVAARKCKQMVGLTNNLERAELWKDAIKNNKNVKARGISMKIIPAMKWFDFDIKPGQLVVSTDAAEWFKANGKWQEPITSIRQPITSYQSIMQTVAMFEDPRLPGRSAIMHPGVDNELARMLGLDGDDTMQFFCDVDVEFNGVGKEPILARETFEDRGFDFPRLQLYFKGMCSQNSIGRTFNQMLQSLAVYRDLKKDSTEVYCTLGAAIDAFAQGIKKNLKTPTLSELADKRNEFCGCNPSMISNASVMKDGLAGEFSEMAEIYLLEKKRSPETIAYLIKKVWGVTMPTQIARNDIKVFRKLDKCTAEMRTNIESFIESPEFASPVTWNIKFNEMLDRQIGDARKLKLAAIDGDESAMATMLVWFDCYAYCAYKIASTYKTSRQALERLQHMSGLAIIASQLVENTTDDGATVGRVIVVNKKTFHAKPGMKVFDVSGKSGSALAKTYRMKSEADRDAVCNDYAKWFANRVKAQDSDVMSELHQIVNCLESNQTVYLACECAPKKCHAETIKQFIENVISAKHVAKSLPVPQGVVEVVKAAPKAGSVVMYNGTKYLHYMTNSSGYAQLIDLSSNKKFPGTPAPTKLNRLDDVVVLKEYKPNPAMSYTYAMVDGKVFSTTTGNRVAKQEILDLFK